VVVVSTIADQWPLERSDVDDVIARYSSNSDYARANVGSRMVVFVRRSTDR
jgi:hypothetical protein